MIFTTSLALVALPALVAAQYGAPAPAGPSSTSSAPAAATAPANTPGQINVQVAADQTYTFSPANVTATNGTLVTFYFPNNGLTHSVTQSSFGAPCTYLAANGSNPGGFDSGLSSNTQFTVNVTDDTKPIWFHCKQVLHCGMGMVGSINAPANGSNTYAAFQAAAKAIGSAEVTETDNGPVTGGVGAIATATPANTASAAAASHSSSSGSSGAGRVVVSGTLGLVAVALAMTVA